MGKAEGRGKEGGGRTRDEEDGRKANADPSGPRCVRESPARTGKERQTGKKKRERVGVRGERKGKD